MAIVTIVAVMAVVTMTVVTMATVVATATEMAAMMAAAAVMAATAVTTAMAATAVAATAASSKNNARSDADEGISASAANKVLKTRDIDLLPTPVADENYSRSPQDSLSRSPGSLAGECYHAARTDKTNSAVLVHLQRQLTKGSGRPPPHSFLADHKVVAMDHLGSAAKAENRGDVCR